MKRLSLIAISAIMLSSPLAFAAGSLDRGYIQGPQTTLFETTVPLAPGLTLHVREFNNRLIPRHAPERTVDQMLLHVFATSKNERTGLEYQPMQITVELTDGSYLVREIPAGGGYVALGDTLDGNLRSAQKMTVTVLGSSVFIDLPE